MEKAIEWVKNHKPHTAVIVIVVVAVIAVLIAAASGAFTQQDKTKDAMKNADENGLYNGVYYFNYQNITKTVQVQVGSHQEDHGHYETYVDYEYCDCGVTR